MAVAVAVASQQHCPIIASQQHYPIIVTTTSHAKKEIKNKGENNGVNSSSCSCSSKDIIYKMCVFVCMSVYSVFKSLIIIFNINYYYYYYKLLLCIIIMYYYYYYVLLLLVCIIIMYYY